ncbi:MAG: hypothetical protein ICV81_12965 [Flavisolibacter sp.]|nr:hypothetical protein [Flavisolibacter sp.]MBD0296078.1 hypothetical protein [Flavisolibacter sp.]MBD0351216.1 hypothetical protein [Flavisolibacter sp.]
MSNQIGLAKKQRIVPDLNNPKGEYVFLTWDDIEFDKDQFAIRPQQVGRIFKPVPLKGSLPLLSRIRHEYFERLYPNKVLKLYFHEGIFVQAKSPGWQVMADLIEAAQEFVHFRFYKSRTKNRIGRLHHHSDAQVRDLFQESLNRNPYFKFLAQCHNEAFRIIPIEEYQNGQWEESFVFRFRTGSGRILIAWENPAPGRATYLFIANDENQAKQLERIESYIVEAIDGKRDLLNDNTPDARKLRKELMYINEKIVHTNFSDYKGNILMQISRY